MEDLEDDGDWALEYHLSQTAGPQQAEVSG